MARLLLFICGPARCAIDIVNVNLNVNVFERVKNGGCMRLWVSMERPPLSPLLIHDLWRSMQNSTISLHYPLVPIRWINPIPWTFHGLSIDYPLIILYVSLEWSSKPAPPPHRLWDVRFKIVRVIQKGFPRWGASECRRPLRRQPTSKVEADGSDFL